MPNAMKCRGVIEVIYGYARVSTRGQARDGNSLEDQERQLIDNGCEKIYHDSFTGTKMDRPAFTELYGRLKAGDKLVVTKLDRFARTAGDGIKAMLGGNPSEWLFVAVFCVSALLMAEFTSHTAAINLMGTISIGTALSLGFSPVPVAVGIALASSLGFMMPVSTPPNAIIYASGYVPITKMIRSGIVIDAIGVICITVPIVMILVKAVMGL